MTAQDSYYRDDEPSYQPHPQGYSSQPQAYPPQPQGCSQYGYSAHSPQPPQYGSYNSPPQPAPYAYGAYPPTQYSAEPHHAYGAYFSGPPPPAPSYVYEPQYSQYPPQPQSYNHAPALDPYGHPAQPPFGVPAHSNSEADRGVMGALAGAAVGGYGGHQVNHGVIGTIGGAVAGSMLEDRFKDKKKKKKHGTFGRRNSSSSSSSSSSSDDEKKKKKHGHQHAAYAQPTHSQNQMLGNFSASCDTITMDGDYDLIASCATVSGNHKLSSIKLDDCFANIDGRLTWSKNGHFVASSRDIALLENGRVLRAACGDGRNGWIVNHIRLDERITNDNGELKLLE